MRYLTLVALLATLQPFSQSSLFAQTNTDPSLVAVIDVAKVFEEHAAFKSRMDAIRVEVEQFEEHLKTQRAALQTRAEELNNWQPGSVEFKQLEAALAKEDADLQIQAAQKRKEVLDEEALVYYETYNQVVDAVRRIAEANRITLVLRYDSSEIDRNERASVIKGVNRNVVLNRGYDLTSMVIDLVNRESAASGQRNPVR